MKEHPFQDWVEKTADYSGVLACGVRLPNQSIAIKTFDEAFPEDRLKELLQCLAEVAFTLRNSQLGSSRLRWVFEHRRLQSVRRKDGALAVLVMSKAHDHDLAIEELITGFLAAVCAAPEDPGLSLPEAAESGAAPDSGVVP
jgi:AAA+ ATPase superfamily predicted ATPase